MQRFLSVGLVSLSLMACAGRYQGERGPEVDAMQNVIGQPPDPSKLTFPPPQAAPGPVQFTPPLIDPAVVKKVWLYPHANAYGDMIGGHYIFVLYKDTTFVELPGGAARVPVTPRLDQLPAQGMPADSPPPTSPQSLAPPASSGRDTPDLVRKIQEARKRYLSNSQSVITSPYGRPEDRP